MAPTKRTPIDTSQDNDEAEENYHDDREQTNPKKADSDSEGDYSDDTMENPTAGSDPDDDDPRQTGASPNPPNITQDTEPTPEPKTSNPARTIPPPTQHPPGSVIAAITATRSDPNDYTYIGKYIRRGFRFLLSASRDTFAKRFNNANKPFLFLGITNNSTTLRVFHSLAIPGTLRAKEDDMFTAAASDSETDDAPTPDNGNIHLFTGERTSRVNPTLHIIPAKQALQTVFAKPTTTSIALKPIKQRFKKAPDATTSLSFPTLAPIPPAWATYFLAANASLTIHETLEWIEERLEDSPDEQYKFSVEQFATWLCAAAVQKPGAGNSNSSCLAIPFYPTFPDHVTNLWAATHLDKLLGPLPSYQRNPAPTNNPSPVNTPPSTPAGVTFDAQALEQLGTSIAAGTVAAAAEFQRNSSQSTPTTADTPKALAGILLSRLLGWAGLHPSDQAELPDIWQSLTEASTKPEKRAVLLHHIQCAQAIHDDFSWQPSVAWVTDFFNWAFAPPAIHNKCNRGFGPMAFADQTDAELQDLADEAQYFGDATATTPSDIEKTRRTCDKPPRTYHTVLDLLKRTHIALEVFFGDKCPLAIDLKAIISTLKASRIRLGGYFDAKNAAHLVWAVTTQTNAFFTTICGPADIQNRKFPETSLPYYRKQIESGMHLALVSTPLQWLEQQANTPRNPSGNPQRQSGTFPKRTHDPNQHTPKDPSPPPHEQPVKRTRTTNPAHHPLLKALISPLTTQFSFGVTLTNICIAAGLTNPRDLDMQGYTGCKVWAIMGTESLPCKRTHNPKPVTDSLAKAILTQLQPGVKAMLAKPEEWNLTRRRE